MRNDEPIMNETDQKMCSSTCHPLPPPTLLDRTITTDLTVSESRSLTVSSVVIGLSNKPYSLLFGRTSLPPSDNKPPPPSPPLDTLLSGVLVQLPLFSLRSSRSSSSPAVRAGCGRIKRSRASFSSFSIFRCCSSIRISSSCLIQRKVGWEAVKIARALLVLLPTDHDENNDMLQARGVNFPAVENAILTTAGVAMTARNARQICRCVRVLQQDSAVL